MADDRGGAGGTLGAAVAAKMAPDGYTWLLGAVHHSIAPSTCSNLPYDITKDFEPIAIIGSVPHVIVVHPKKFPKNDLKSIMEEIRKHPGKDNYASTGNGTSQHLTGELSLRCRTNYSLLIFPIAAQVLLCRIESQAKWI
ncbi:tripartite tricarboxylate transporter substrate-binding protein [Polynucleobacter necessarius]|uniref:tripartite tricarboxylate transporter substrate-binding protein n=1 Tax=Polynucleobacter necessarius TaxID=576610 RepID=UPI001E4EDAA6|nr:tripartite tricarboxylate transporter substrate-binding protein [Polynucleobacter necessarius]